MDDFVVHARELMAWRDDALVELERVKQTQRMLLTLLAAVRALVNT